MEVSEGNEADAEEPGHGGGGAHAKVVVGLFPDGEGEDVGSAMLWKAAMKAPTKLMTIKGSNCGISTWRTRPQKPAPSMAAAS